MLKTHGMSTNIIHSKIDRPMNILKRPPTIFHITHWKAGSQWVAEILKLSASERFVPWHLADPSANEGRGESSFLLTPLKPGSIYGTIYMAREGFNRRVYEFPVKNWKNILKLRLPQLSNWWYFSILRFPTKRFFVMRDLRDTLISFYFSTKNSHEIEVDIMNTRRQRLSSISLEDGLIYLLDNGFPTIAEIQASWINADGTLILRYEDILENEFSFFEQLLDYCEINIRAQRMQRVIDNNSFEKVAGRKRGDEDSFSHYRKGIVGDWNNHFTEKVKTKFKKRYGQLLIDTGYEKGLDW